MAKPLISVIVPVYRVEKYLRRCVDSIRAQSYTATEILLVDDGSPDGCPAMCDAMAEQDSRIRVIHKENGGLSSARNAGLEAASGTYIAFVDSDDFIAPNMLERLEELAERHGADLVMAKYREVTSEAGMKTAPAAQETVFTGEQIERAFLEQKVDSVCVGLYTRAAIGEIRFPEGRTSEDIPFNFQIFRKIGCFVRVPEELYFYFYNSESISNGALDADMFNYLEFRRQIYDYYTQQGNGPLAKTAEALYVRAAMGLQLRMAVFGLSDGLDEKECRERLSSVFRAHKKAFFSAPSVPLSRKLFAIGVFDFYSVAKMAGKIRKCVF